MTPGRSRADLPAVEALLRHRYLLFLALGTVLVLGSATRVTPDNDWHFFAWGSDLLFGEHRPLVRSGFVVEAGLAGGLHLYASAPFLQIGPPPLLLAKALQFGPSEGLLLAGAVTQALGLIFVILVDRTRPTLTRTGRWAALLAGAVVTLAWSLIAHYRHLDDALALVCVAAGLLLLLGRRPSWAGVLLGTAAASKPWAVPVLALVLSAPTWTARVRGLAAAVLTAAAFWGPFLLADAGTLAVGGHALYGAPDGPLAALGVYAFGAGGPLRLLQWAGGGLLAVVLVLRGQARLAPLAAFSFRLAIDPAAYLYYPAAVMAAAYIADRGCDSHGLPLWTAASCAAWVVAETVSADAAGGVRLVTYAGLVAGTLVVAARPRITAAAPS